MQIDAKLAGFKSYMSENGLTKGGVKTAIDQSAVAPSEQNQVLLDMQLDEDGNPRDYTRSKKKQKKNSSDKKEEKKEEQKKSDADLRKHNLKLLNLI